MTLLRVIWYRVTTQSSSYPESAAAADVLRAESVQLLSRVRAATAGAVQRLLFHASSMTGIGQVPL